MPLSSTPPLELDELDELEELDVSPPELLLSSSDC
jgi:hypothetical protein